MKRHLHLITAPRLGDIGQPQRHIEFEPMPTTEPVHEPTPATAPTRRDAMLAVSPHRMETCQCGFYAYFAPQIEVATETYTRPSGNYATGVIEAYGRTIVGTKGFRAERARILAIALNGAPGPDAASWTRTIYEQRRAHTALACHRLGLPLFGSVEELLAEFPTSSAEEFRQEVAS